MLRCSRYGPQAWCRTSSQRGGARRNGDGHSLRRRALAWNCHMRVKEASDTEAGTYMKEWLLNNKTGIFYIELRIHTVSVENLYRIVVTSRRPRVPCLFLFVCKAGGLIVAPILQVLEVLNKVPPCGCYRCLGGTSSNAPQAADGQDSQAPVYTPPHVCDSIQSDIHLRDIGSVSDE